MVDQQVLRQQISKTDKDSGSVIGDWQGSVLIVPSLVASAGAGAGGFSFLMARYCHLCKRGEIKKRKKVARITLPIIGLSMSLHNIAAARAVDREFKYNRCSNLGLFDSGIRFQGRGAPV